MYRLLVNKIMVSQAVLGLLVCIVAASISGPAEVSADERSPDAAVRTIGPGQLSWSLTPGGHWTRLVLRGDEQRELVMQGGFAVFAADAQGDPVQLANTAGKGLPVRPAAGSLGVHGEGVKGGYRAPSLAPDDDGDGRVDEDRLDGVDNDGDGEIDEDFAAIGDEMIVTEFGRRLESKGGSLVFHLEAYAWSLPHIDHAIMVSLDVENRTKEPLRDVRIALVIERAGPFLLSDRTLRVRSGFRASPLTAQAAVCEGSMGDHMAVVSLGGQPAIGDDWRTGYAVWGTRPAEAMADLIRSAGDAGADGLEQPIRIEDHATVFVLSPSVRTLGPGESQRIDFALVGATAAKELEAVLANAVRTFHGDGRHAYLPPPVSLKPRLVWGTYRPAENDPEAIIVSLEQLGDRPIRPQDIVSVSGGSRSGIERREAEPGVVELVLRGEAAKRALEDPDRAALTGRLRSGEIFEAVLRPNRRFNVQEAEADRYWNTPGRLDPNFLSGSPNPFRDFTTIFYEVPATIEQEDGTTIQLDGTFETSVKVFSVAGRLVSSLVDEQVSPGGHSVTWSATDDKGNAVASGVYYVRLQIGQKFITKRFILLK